jgi:hypothetical protein
MISTQYGDLIFLKSKIGAQIGRANFLAVTFKSEVSFFGLVGK